MFVTEPRLKRYRSRAMPSLLCSVLATLLAAEPQHATRFNAEPFGFAAAGALSLSFGAWQQVTSNETLRLLNAIPLKASSADEARSRLHEAARLTSIGNQQTAAAVGFFITGAVFLASALVWLLAEGLWARDWFVR